MAWRSSGATNRELIENLSRNNLIKSPAVKEAFLKVPPFPPPPLSPFNLQTNPQKVDRAHYAPRSPYQDTPQPIGHRATISAPHMHAAAAEKLLPFIVPSPSRSAPRVLDVGSGSGYLTHVLAELGAATVVGVEHIRELRDLGEENMRKSEEGRGLLESGRVRFVVGDGRKGWDEGEGEGWDAIHVGAAAREVHGELVGQLRRGGRMFIPVEEEGGEGQWIWCVDKGEGGEVRRERLFGVRYVPLTDPPGV